MYLANGTKQLVHLSPLRILVLTVQTEVAQQSRIRHKEDFIIAFSPAIAEATSIAYKGASAEIQAKLRRVIDVWKERAIFEPPIQAAIENRLSGRLRENDSINVHETKANHLLRARQGTRYDENRVYELSLHCELSARTIRQADPRPSKD